MYATFDNSLITGNSLIDGQHEELITKINRLVECCEDNGGQAEAIQMLDYLSDYTEYHFQEEEKLQIKADYPGYAEHKKQHDEFRDTVKELHAMLVEEQGPTPAFVKAVNQNVIDWLYGHIKGFDCSVATYLFMNTHPERL